MSTLRENKKSYRLFDATFVSDDTLLSLFLTEITNYQPDVVAIQCMSSEWKLVQILFDALFRNYRKDFVVIIGGSHPTVAPEEVIASPFVDILVLGEGELATREIWDSLERGADHTRTLNCWIKIKGRIIRNHLRPLIQDLDQLPYPDWATFDTRHTYLHGLRSTTDRKPRRQVPMETSRGCPYSCAFCINSHLHAIYKGLGSFHREKSVDRVIAEAEYLRDRVGATLIQFVDENFITNRSRLEELSLRFPKEVGLPIAILVSANALDLDRIKLLAEMGVVYMEIGIETGNERYRIDTLRKPVTNEQIISAFRLAREFGIMTKGSNMIGLPFETRQMIEETIALNNLVQPDITAVYTFFPFPGTPLHHLVMEKGLASAYDYLPDTYEESILNVDGLSTIDLQYYRSRFPNVTLYRGPFPRRDLGTLMDCARRI
ncbi:B12-binding domain-containing radical SAM protein [Dehalococcoidia bacterium]|nr:B12-binding domain-containing radical SAM protein [Dehalococcoidia bacterium]